jgi:hypothetical protein
MGEIKSLAKSAVPAVILLLLYHNGMLDWAPGFGGSKGKK